MVYARFIVVFLAGNINIGSTLRTNLVIRTERAEGGLRRTKRPKWPKVNFQFSCVATSKPQRHGKLVKLIRCNYKRVERICITIFDSAVRTLSGSIHRTYVC